MLGRCGLGVVSTNPAFTPPNGVTHVGWRVLDDHILYLLGPAIAASPVVARAAVLSGLMAVTLTRAVLSALTRIFRGGLAAQRASLGLHPPLIAASYIEPVPPASAPPW